MKQIIWTGIDGSDFHPDHNKAGVISNFLRPKNNYIKRFLELIY